MKIIYSESRELSIRKWQWIVNNWNYQLDNNENIARLLQAIPKLESLNNYCGWCEYTLNWNCSCYCVLYQTSNGDACSLWYQIFCDEKTTQGIRQENAIKILNACKAIPEVEN
jgi:hypothetical protein